MPQTFQITDPNLIRFLDRAFHPESFDTVGVRTGSQGLTLFSLDNSKSILGVLTLPSSALEHFGSSEAHTLSVSAKVLSKALTIPEPTDIQDMRIVLSWEFTEQQLRLTGEISSRYYLARALRDIPTGIREIPRVQDFSKAARCTVSDVHLLRYVSQSLSDYDDITLRITDAEIHFSPHEGAPRDFFRVTGVESQGEATSTFGRSHFETITRVDQVAGLHSLMMEVMNSGLGRFTYHHGEAVLSYVLGPRIEG